jgi:hypothetical protein
MIDDARHVTERSFLRHLRIAILAVTVTVLFLMVLPMMLTHLDSAPGPAAQIGLFLLLLAVAAADAVLVVRNRPWGRLRWPVLAVLLAAYTGFTLLGPDGSVLITDNWQLGIIGWFGLLLLFDRPLWQFLLMLLGCAVMAAVPVLRGPAGWPGVATVGITIVAIGGFQTLTASVAGMLRRVAASATLAATSVEGTRTRRAVARRVHADRRRRYREIASTTGPLLTGLANGSLDPADGDVIQRCAIEAARMRRLFAESDEREDRLLHELRACVDIAERRGLQVEVVGQGHWPDLPREIRRALTDAPMRMLCTATATARPARVTVIGTPDTVSVSVLAGEGATVPEAAECHGVHTTTITDDGLVWVEATWQAPT